MAICRMIELGKFIFSNTSAEKMSIEGKTNIKIFSNIQLCRIKRDESVISPETYWSARTTDRQDFKIATTNENGWFIDVLNNTPYPFIQTSLLLGIHNIDGKILAEETLLTNLQTYNNDALSSYDELFENGNFLYRGEVGPLALSDLFEVTDGVIYEFKTFAVALFNDGHYECYEGFNWNTISGYTSVIATNVLDMDLSSCMLKKGWGITMSTLVPAPSSDCVIM